MANVLVCEPGRFAWTCAKTARSPSSPHARANGVDAIAYVEAIKTEEGFGHEHATAFSPRRSLSRSGRLPLVSMPEDRPQNAVTSRFDGLAGDRCLANTCDATEPCSVCGTALSLLFAELEQRLDQLLHQFARPMWAGRLHQQSVVHRSGARASLSGGTQATGTALRAAVKWHRARPSVRKDSIHASAASPGSQSMRRCRPAERLIAAAPGCISGPAGCGEGP
jgi:hypothetical protein